MKKLLAAMFVALLLGVGYGVLRFVDSLNPDLTRLNRGQRGITDISRLAGLKKLEELYLTSNPIPEDQKAMPKKAVVGLKADYVLVHPFVDCFAGYLGQLGFLEVRFLGQSPQAGGDLIGELLAGFNHSARLEAPCRWPQFLRLV